MPTPVKNLLQQLGLHPSEAGIYLACLRLGEAGVQEIAHEAKLARTTTASILDRLVTQGFVSVSHQRGKQKYWIEDPHILVEREKARLGVFEELSSKLHTEYHKADKKPMIETYDSPEGITNLMCKVLEEAQKGDEFLTWECPGGKHYQAVMPDELFHELSKKKTVKGIRTRALIPTGHQSYMRPEALKHTVDVRVLPSGLNIEISLWVIQDSIVIFSGTHAFAIRVTHRHTTESFRSLFEFLWNLSSPLSIPSKGSHT